MGKILIGLSGPAGVGKDTAAKYLADTFNLMHCSFASPIKAALEAIGFSRKDYDNDEMKDAQIPGLGVSYRKLAQTLGTEWGRSMHPEFWLQIGKRQYESQLGATNCNGVVFSDVRFPDEARWIRETGLLFHITGPSRRPIASDGANHASAVPLDWEPGDVVITNTGSLTFFFGQLSGVVNQAFL